MAALPLTRELRVLVTILLEKVPAPFSLFPFHVPFSFAAADTAAALLLLLLLWARAASPIDGNPTSPAPWGVLLLLHDTFQRRTVPFFSLFANG